MIVDELNKSIEEINKEIDNILKELKFLNGKGEESLDDFDLSSKEASDRKYVLWDRLNILQVQLRKKEYELMWLEPPIKTNEIIELRKCIDSRNNNVNPLKGEYSICIVGQRTKVGTINYNGYHYDENHGDVGYKIIRKYRGKGYAIQALCLLGDLLNENGVDDFWISADPKIFIQLI